MKCLLFTGILIIADESTCSADIFKHASDFFALFPLFCFVFWCIITSRGMLMRAPLLVLWILFLVSFGEGICIEID